jgi:hypothetical protein
VQGGVAACFINRLVAPLALTPPSFSSISTTLFYSLLSGRPTDPRYLRTIPS